jgi:nucleoside-diphosphate-sugar epimerase
MNRHLRLIQFSRFCVINRKGSTEFQPVVQEKYFVFVTGGTGFMGRKLIASLLQSGHRVKTLVCEGSQHRPLGRRDSHRDPLSATSFVPHVAPAHTFVQLVEVAHPNPLKANEFRAIDQTAGCAGADAAARCGVTWRNPPRL